MANTLLRERVINLRSKGKSLNDLSRHLKVPKSTIRYWCRDIILTVEQQKRLFVKQRLGAIRAAEKIRRKRIDITKQLFKEGLNAIGTLTPRELLLIGSALYWAEGYRKGDGVFGFTNSDPKMVKFIIHWLQKSFSIGKESINLRICINKIHKNRIEDIKKFWSTVTKIPYSQFSKPTFIKVRNRKIYLNPNNYFGTLRIKVRRSTNLRRKIMGYIEGLSRIVYRHGL